MKKYRYACLAVLLGMVLLLWPETREEQPEAPETEQLQASSDQKTGDAEPEDLEQRLSELLAQIQGAGEVTCMVTYRDDGLREYLLEEYVDSGGAEQQKTVILDRDEGQEPVLVTTAAATVQGVAVVCDGGDDPTVRLQMIQTVAVVTGLKTDHITVVKRESKQH